MKHYSKLLQRLAVIVVVSAGFYVALVQYFSRQEVWQTENRAAFFASTIDDALRRLWHLPFVISQNEAVVEALQNGNGSALSPRLREFALSADADHIFLMDLTGNTIAASNFGTADSFIGNSYMFRPYFRDAVLGGTGQFFAIGATTGEPGYFVSAPVRDNAGGIIGVIVVKTGLDSLSRAWQNSGERILVSNPDTVVLLASDNVDQFRTLQPLTDPARQSLEKAQQFGDQPLLPLDWQVGGNGRVTLDGAEYLLAEAQIKQQDWTVYLLSDLTGIRLRAGLVIAGVLAALFGVIIAITGFRSARLREALWKSDADRVRLTREIEVRRAAESDLKVAKDGLERASRLAALGQLSASITHELGQPISAMRNYLTAEEIATDAPPNSLNPQLSGLVDRMQNINNQLRFFATPGVEDSRVFDLRRANDAAAELVAHGMSATNVTLIRHYAQGAVHVAGNQQRIEQVLVNLLRNAIDAVSGQALRQITVEVDCSDRRAFVRVTDTGTGLEGRSMDNLQEPFMTTKSSGVGMGLGLAISAQIAKDMNGTIEAQDARHSGAEFTLWLPLSEEHQ
ncbi:sensor histidine kinase [Candidatus Halocynthiibacter alkanivorans]|uniref:sensor histidine kinase n=1 Tax=Candidatus Halocynthiibacter alkanivorans TaxID=2267619 RepID=UPI000DF1CB02|nr:ATP-binding protein [Candidatus Halocynthiibacter alkanivorans]